MDDPLTSSAVGKFPARASTTNPSGSTVSSASLAVRLLASSARHNFTTRTQSLLPDVGVATMRAGDKVKLTIPPEMGYGAMGAAGVIPPNATLIFEVELLEVQG